MKYIHIIKKCYFFRSFNRKLGNKELLDHCIYNDRAILFVVFKVIVQ